MVSTQNITYCYLIKERSVINKHINSFHYKFINHKILFNNHIIIYIYIIIIIYIYNYIICYTQLYIN